MVYSTYRFALLTFNLLCSIEAMKESFVGGDSVVDAYGAEDKGQKLQVSLGEHDTGHGETEDEANGEGVAFVEVTASGALKTIARPHNSSLVEAVQADEAELAGEAEEDEDAEEADDDQPVNLTAAAFAAHAHCFECISKGLTFCKDSGNEKCFESASQAASSSCLFKVTQNDGVHLHVPAVDKTYTLSHVASFSPSTIPKEVKQVQANAQTLATLPAFGDCGVEVGKGTKKKWVDCAQVSDNCPKSGCDRFCSARYQTSCDQKSERSGSQTKQGWVCEKKKTACRKCIEKTNRNGSQDHVFCKDAGKDQCYDNKEAAKAAGCSKDGMVTIAAMMTPRSKQYTSYEDCRD